MIKTNVTLLGIISILFIAFCNCESIKHDVPSLPFCPNKEGPGYVLVSTLDGKLSALNSSGHLAWQIDTGPGALLSSNIHQRELQNNGEWVRIIPSLSGMLYRFNGESVDAIPISAEMLLKASFRYSDDLVIAGGIEVRKYGIGFHSGKLLYECTPLKCLNGVQREVDDVLLVERTTQTIRAVEPHTGHERWNFSVGLHNITLPSFSCKDTNSKSFDWNISAILPDGMLKASTLENNIERSWSYTFPAPIVRVWQWSGSSLTEINLFAPRNIPNMLTAAPYLPSIYMGMYKKQLYIQESVVMQHVLNGKSKGELAAKEGQSIAKIPWKPISASNSMENDHDDDSTALLVLDNSEDVNGSGFYLYSDEKHVETLPSCEKNESVNYTEEIEMEMKEEGIKDFTFFVLFYVNHYYLEIFVVSLTLIYIFLRKTHKVKTGNQDIIIIQRPVEAQITSQKRNSERDSDSYGSESFSSRYINDFDTIQCLGKGGFGVVFEVKQKIDECHYAIKRITLPNDDISRERVMREVKALAKLDHQNIVRYFCSWVENPPIGWEDEHGKICNGISITDDLSTSYTTTNPSNLKRLKKESICINIPNEKTDSDLELLDCNSNKSANSDDDSFIVFEKSNSVSKSSSLHISFAEDTLKTLKETNNSSAPTVELSISGYSTESEKKVSLRHSRNSSQTSDIVLPKIAPMYLYIQMQLCQKQSLKDWLNANYDRDYPFVLDIFSQILHAVEYVHLRGLIHRDLKPSNIFFSLDGQIKVGDFGLVKDMEDSLELESSKKLQHSSYGHTREVGTRLYMSPEQIQGHLYDCKVDIYALGLIFFELLVPFSTDMERIKTLTDVKKHIYPEDFQKKYPHEYELLQGMLSENPNKRFSATGLKSRPPLSLKQ